MNDQNPPLDAREAEFPAIETAYGFVHPSYQLMVGRFDAADTRLASLLTFTATVTLGFPVLARTVRPDINFTSPVFYLAVALFLVAAGVGILGRTWDVLTLVDPMRIYNEQLEKSRWEFMKDAICHAGENFEANRAAVEVKGACANWVTILMLLEMAALIAWLAFTPSV